MVGYDMEITPSTGYSYFRNSSNQLEKISIGNDVVPVISITGMHFWGHAEFFTSFSLDRDKNDNAYSSFHRFGSTGGKYFPIRVKEKRLVPFVGMSLSSFSYQQGNGPKIRRLDYPILTGLTYNFKRGAFEMGSNFHFQTNYDYYISKTEVQKFKIPMFSFFVDFKYFFDFSVTSMEKEKSGKLKEQLNQLKEDKALNSWFLAYGPSYSFFTGESTYNSKKRPYLDDYAISNFYHDVAFGYYFFKPDLNFVFSYRAFETELSGYDVKQILNRISFSIEAYKFLMDYHGFVPFVGGILSFEDVQVREYDSGILAFDEEIKGLFPAFIFGWDIRPTRADWWSIRSNIRYFPFNKRDVESGLTINWSQVELNFLQLVLFPNRIYSYLKKDK